MYFDGVQTSGYRKVLVSLAYETATWQQYQEQEIVPSRTFGWQTGHSMQYPNDGNYSKFSNPIVCSVRERAANTSSDG